VIRCRTDAVLTFKGLAKLNGAEYCLRWRHKGFIKFRFTAEIVLISLQTEWHSRMIHKKRSAVRLFNKLQKSVNKCVDCTSKSAWRAIKKSQQITDNAVQFIFKLHLEIRRVWTQNTLEDAEIVFILLNENSSHTHTYHLLLIKTWYLWNNELLSTLTPKVSHIVTLKGTNS
jgi:hypothetical protein